MSRNKTDFRNLSDGKVTRVTEENGAYYIGNSNERAEGRMAHFKQVSNGKVHINRGSDDNFDPDPYDGAHSAEDI